MVGVGIGIGTGFHWLERKDGPRVNLEDWFGNLVWFTFLATRRCTTS